MSQRLHEMSWHPLRPGIRRADLPPGHKTDAANRRQTVTLPNAVVGTYTFDDADQLLALSYANGSTQIGDLSYTYDAAGRRVTAGGSLATLAVPSASVSGTYDAANRLTQWGSAALTYDGNGNVATNGASNYTWNVRNQLTNTSDGSATFSYDAIGRRTSRTVSGVTTPYLYDGDNAATVAGYQVLSGLNLDESYAQIAPGGTTNSITDGLGSTVALTDGSAATTASYSYTPYGATSATGTGDTPFQFTGRENDGASNLYYYRARYYSPQMGRFIAEDPSGFAGGINAYAYADGDPIDFTDPTGLLIGGRVNAGESYGDAAAQYWADKAIETGNPLYNFPGAIAALWTPCTSDATAATLFVGYAARVFGPFSPRGVPRPLAREATSRQRPAISASADPQVSARARLCS